MLSLDLIRESAAALSEHSTLITNLGLVLVRPFDERYAKEYVGARKEGHDEEKARELAAERTMLARVGVPLARTQEVFNGPLIEVGIDGWKPTKKLPMPKKRVIVASISFAENLLQGIGTKDSKPKLPFGSYMKNVGMVLLKRFGRPGTRDDWGLRAWDDSYSPLIIEHIQWTKEMTAKAKLELAANRKREQPPALTPSPSA